MAGNTEQDHLGHQPLEDCQGEAAAELPALTCGTRQDDRRGPHGTRQEDGGPGGFPQGAIVLCAGRLLEAIHQSITAEIAAIEAQRYAAAIKSLAGAMAPTIDQEKQIIDEEEKSRGDAARALAILERIDADPWDEDEEEGDYLDD